MFSVEYVSDEWAEYGFRELYLMWNGEPVPWKAIVRDGKLVHVASRKYKLLPNQVALKAADMVAESMGAVKLMEFMDVDSTLYALYDTGIDAEPIRGVEVRLGIYVYNSVDGSLAFGASVLSILKRRGRVSYVLMPYKSLVTYLSPDAAVAIVREPHRPGLETDVERIADKLRRLVERGREAVGLYRLWSEIELDKDIAETLWERIPRIYLPRYVKALKDGVTLTELITVWDTYVDIAEKIWVGKESGKEAKIDRKVELYRMLHNALPTPKK